MHKRKLIEVALPLEAINRESAREKSIRARVTRDTAHLVGAPSARRRARGAVRAAGRRPELAIRSEFPTEELQRAERERLHALIERLVEWENTGTSELLAEAHEEILRSTGGKPPRDPRPVRRRRHHPAGGAASGLGVTRLGPQSGRGAHQQGADRDSAEVRATSRRSFRAWQTRRSGRGTGAEGLAADVRAYGEWMRDEARERIGHLYPKRPCRRDQRPSSPGSGRGRWLARTRLVESRCRSFGRGGLARRRARRHSSSRRWWRTLPAGRVMRVDVRDRAWQRRWPRAPATTGRSGARRDVHLRVRQRSRPTYIKSEGQAGRLGQHLMATVAEGKRQTRSTSLRRGAVSGGDGRSPDDLPTRRSPPRPTDLRVAGIRHDRVG